MTQIDYITELIELADKCYKEYRLVDVSNVISDLIVKEMDILAKHFNFRWCWDDFADTNHSIYYSLSNIKTISTLYPKKD